MGTRYDDQPPEHWAGPASLDPTPVWKQYLLVVLLLLGALAIIGVAAFLAVAPQLATPPALVPGDRLVLLREQVDGPSGGPVRVVLGRDGPRIEHGLAGMEFRVLPDWSPNQEYLWVFRIAPDEYIAVSGYWITPETGACPVSATLGSSLARTDPAIPAFRSECVSVRTFDVRGGPLQAPRGLDRYLVSVDGDRVIVNLSRTLRGIGKTPQPTRSPL